MAFVTPFALAKAPADLEPLILGGFLCKENCFDEEYSFAKDDGERLFNTYTHSRPSISRARWTLEGDRLKVYEDDGKALRYDFRVVRATAKRLVLQQVDSNEPPVVLDRIVEKKKAAPAKQ
ncbi:hypothetical protein DSM104440_00515 [Usitatibacter palustris]|uniref:NlpE N-terminal domain-containing protein n=2 Tax=Usitatibacter palustris TaxID=2732487 RepID=A0A6M4H329_9PROT|nr:hypothetical protein DSM104440_00515 [Usitatibacter palustris]